MELAADREKNRKERLTFIRFYAAWVRRVSNREWSSQQAELINAFMENAGNYALTREQYPAYREPAKIGTITQGLNPRLKETGIQVFSP